MKCSFCGNALKSGSGKMFVKNDGTIYYYCSSKCEKNAEMKRDPKKRKWSRGKKS